ncbi:MAG: carbohydrate ABC transporter permease [Spirochaetota bacterium]
MVTAQGARRATVRRIKQTQADVIFDVINTTIMVIVLIIVLYPLYFVVIASVSDPVEVGAGRVIVAPREFTMDGYRRILRDRQIWTGYRNTVLYTLAGTAINVSLTMLLAYPLSRKRFSGRGILMVFLVITMYFRGGIVPTYLLVRGLGLINTFAVMVLLGAVSVHHTIIARTFLQSNVPNELQEAAAMDGCGHFRFFVSVVLPTSPAILAVLSLFYAVSHWNEFFRGLVFLTDESRFPLQLVLRSILVQAELSEDMLLDVQAQEELRRLRELIQFGVIIVASLPVLVAYPFLQRYFIKGVMIGSLKG